MKPFPALANARSHLQRALDLDPTLAEAHCTLALIKSWYDLDWSGAEREFQTALQLDPSQIPALIYQSLHLSVQGRHQEAVQSVRQAREIDPYPLPSIFIWDTPMLSLDSTISLFGRCSTASNSIQVTTDRICFWA